MLNHLYVCLVVVVVVVVVFLFLDLLHVTWKLQKPYLTFLIFFSQLLYYIWRIRHVIAVKSEICHNGFCVEEIG